MSESEPQTESQRLRSLPLVRPVDLREFDDKNFQDEVVKANGLVVFDLWSETSPMSKTMGTVMRRLAVFYEQEPVKVGRLEVERNLDLVRALEVKAVPHVMVVLGGDVVLELVGDRSFEELKEKLAPFVTRMK